MPRALWKGSISFGLVNVPVALYPAERRSELKLRLLDRRDLAPVGYQRVNKRTGEEVPSEEVVKGYEYEDGRYVVLTAEDFERADVEATRTVEILDFVDGGEIDPVHYEKPYYLAPLKRESKGYALLRETLRRTGKVGIARVVIRTREYLAAVIARGPVLVLATLRFAHEVRGAGELELPGDDLEALGVREKELKMAQRLVEEMAEAWDPERYRDEYRENLLALIEEKASTGEVREGAEPAPSRPSVDSDVVDLMSVLKESVDETRGGSKRTKRKAA